MKPAHIIALVVLIGSLAVTLYSFAGAVANHVTIAQAIKRPSETVQVPGDIVKETVNYDPTRGALSFDIVDPKTKERLRVQYDQPKPENFDSANKVEARGTYSNGVFHATELLVKCPSKYRDQPEQKSDAGDSGLLIAIGTPAVLGVGAATWFFARRRPGV